MSNLTRMPAAVIDNGTGYVADLFFNLEHFSLFLKLKSFKDTLKWVFPVIQSLNSLYQAVIFQPF